MTKAQQREKLNWFLFMAGYFLAGYESINRFNIGRPNPADLSFGFERAIPLVPNFIVGYILVYISILFLYIVITDLEEWRRTVVSSLAATTCAYIFFLVFPIHMALRPEAPADPGVMNALVRIYFFIDPPYNCFPSLHVTYPMLGTLLVWRRHPLMRWVFLAMTLIVAVSVVFVKQHYVLDVVGGFANAVLWYWLTACYGQALTSRVCRDEAG